MQPSAYQPPHVGRQARWRWALSWQHWTLFAAIILLGLFVLFLAFARSIQIEVRADSLQRGAPPEPVMAATLDLSAWLQLPLGNRYLVLPGIHSLQVSAEGFVPQSLDVDVTQDRFQQFSVNLTRLPGLLAVTVRSSVTDDPIGVNDAQLWLDPAERFSVPGQVVDIPAGEQTVTVDAPLYRPATKSLIVLGEARVQDLEFILEPAWANYAFSATQEGVSLSVDGELQGELPLTLPLEEGARVIRFSKPLFTSAEQTVIVTADESVQVPPITLNPAPGVVELASTPPGAAVLVNDEYRGLTPLSLELQGNAAHALQVYRPGFKVVAQTLEVAPEQTVQRAIALEQDTVPVQVSVSPATAQVTINQKVMGRGSLNLELPTLSHTIEVSAPGYVSQSRTLVPTASTSQLVSFELLTREQHYWATIPSEYTNSVGSKMVLFKAPGQVAMGSSRREAGRRANEVEYTAELNKAFFVSTLEITNAQYREFKASHSSGNYQRNSLDLNNYPVVRVSWQQAALYCNWLSERENLTPFYSTKAGFVAGHNPAADGYRLLTEAEWTWLASHYNGKRQTYVWGDSEQFPSDAPFGNVADEKSRGLINFLLEGYTDGYVAAAPVGSFPANSKGLYDLEGNVAEWTHDWYSAQGSKPVAEQNTKAVALDPLGPEIGEYHVVKGPSWARGYLPQLRWAYRDSSAKGRHDLGFRVARYAQP